jgi:prepilin-type N-terminal cleavage/methylation domain-containing protein
MKTSDKGFSIVEIIMAVVIVGLLSAVGWLYISNQSHEQSSPKGSPTNTSAKKVDTKKDKCSGGDITAKSGTFCAEDVGLHLSVPDVFKGKIKKINNYTVMTQNTIQEQGKVFGKSETAYEATLTGKNDTYSLTIAVEPLRNFRPKSYTPSLFNRDTGQMYYIDSSKEAESTILDGVKFYNYGIGDAGSVSSIYMAVINDRIVVVSLVSQQQLGDPATRNYILDEAAYQTMFNQYKAGISSLKVV